MALEDGAEDGEAGADDAEAGLDGRPDAEVREVVCEGWAG